MTITEIDLTEFDKLVDGVSIPCEARTIHDYFKNCQATAKWIIVVGCDKHIDMGTSTLLVSDTCLTLITRTNWFCNCNGGHMVWNPILSKELI